MQNLHLVGVNLTRDGLILSDRRGTGGRSFVVSVDPALVALVAELAAEGDVHGSEEIHEPAPRPESALSVREIQSRLRGGRSIDEIADAAGVSPGWIERFAPPIRAEQARIIGRALTSTLERPRLGPSEEPLGRAVAHNLASKGLRLSPQEFAAGWSAHQRVDGRWVVQHTWTQRGRTNVATWEFDEGMEGLEAADRRSLEVGYVAPGSGRPKRATAPTPTGGSAAEVAAPAPRPQAPASRAEPATPARPTPPPRPTATDDVEPWAEALDWLALNDDEPRPGAEDLSIGLLRLIERTPAAEHEGANASRPPPPIEAGPPGWVSDGSDEPPAAVARPGDESADPPGFPAAGDEATEGSEGVAARIHADRVAPEPAADPAEPAAPPSRQRHPASPRRRNRPLPRSVTGSSGALRPTPPVRLDVEDLARRTGLDRVGVAPVEVFARTRADLHARRSAGLHADMQFTYRNPDRSTDPARVLDGARSLVVGASAYPNDPGPAPHRPSARVARYATGGHYDRLRDGLEGVAAHLRDAGGRTRVVFDDNALVDREAARRAGIGDYGKNANLLLPGAGSWFVLGSVVTDLDLAPTGSASVDPCGSCRRCLDGCPTGAIVVEGVVDARRCLAWLVQAGGTFPVEHRVALGDRIYGCDECQDVCPENRRHAVPSGAADGWVDLIEILDASDAELLERHGSWYLADRDPAIIRRNALLVLGNVGSGRDRETRRVVGAALVHEQPMVRAHAVWAARRLGLAHLLDPTDTHPEVVLEQHHPVEVR